MLKKVAISEELAPDTRIWRYMSLDKLVDLISTRSLYLSPSTHFEDNDPYENQDHPQLTGIWAEIVRPRYEELKQLKSQFRALGDSKMVSAIEAQLVEFRTRLDRDHRKMKSSIRACCWHSNDGESEAMWKLYGDAGKCVALVTTVASLAQSLYVETIAEVIDIIPIEYLDYTRNDYPVGKLKKYKDRIAATKRLAYKHEQEVRLTIRPAPNNSREWQKPDFGLAEPIRIPLDINTLIKEIYLSPYAREPFASSVKAVCRAFDVSEQLVKTSELLRYKPTSITDLLDTSSDSARSDE